MDERRTRTRNNEKVVRYICSHVNTILSRSSSNHRVRAKITELLNVSTGALVVARCSTLPWFSMSGYLPTNSGVSFPGVSFSQVYAI